jgi:hypothetical protein
MFARVRTEPPLKSPTGSWEGSGSFRVPEGRGAKVGSEFLGRIGGCRKAVGQRRLHKKRLVAKLA